MKYILILFLSLVGANVNAQSFLPVLSEGKVWYCKYTYTSGSYNFTIEIDGDTIVGEHNCKKAVLRGTTDRGSTFNYAEPCYEENGRVYNFDPDPEAEDVGSRTGYTVPHLICDFNLMVGDRAWNSYVTKIDTIEVRGVERRRLFLDNSNTDIWVEGIGPSTDHWPTTRPIPTNGHVITVDSCYENGTLIFTQEDFITPAKTDGVKVVEVVSSDSEKMYDTTGKVIKAPKRNEIYIKDGRKRIQR